MSERKGVEDADTSTWQEESENGSTSSSESNDESSDTSDDRSSSDSDEGQEEEESSSDNEGSADNEGQESDRHLEEDILAKKREDFEKMQELVVHMDNIVRRLSRFFPRAEDCNHKTSPQRGTVPVLPSLPQPETSNPVSPRVMTMEKAVSARKLTIDRAVSVASDSHFDGGFSVSGDGYHGESAKQEKLKRGQEIYEAPSGLRGSWGRAEDGVARRAGVKNHNDQETTVQDARERTAQWAVERKKCAETPAKVIQPPLSEERRESYDVGIMRSGQKRVEEDLYREHMLWDELCDSLVGREGVMSGCRLGGTALDLEKIRRDRAAEEKRRGLINEALAVLLESSIEEEDMESK